jgi:hypothetical protein
MKFCFALFLFVFYSFIFFCPRRLPSLPSFTALSAFDLHTPLECTREYSATTRHAAIMHMRSVTNLNCSIQLRAIFSHLCAMYRQLKFCGQSLLDGLYKRAEFQVKFRPDKPDHSLVSKAVVY